MPNSETTSTNAVNDAQMKFGRRLAPIFAVAKHLRHIWQEKRDRQPQRDGAPSDEQ